jgi:peptidoglycan/LPS O-acetylase OafA/YrhL
MKLIDYVKERDNNFNLIRIGAALAVLLTHSYPLALGGAAGEPMREWLGVTMGSIAVDLFFITSGFLISASLMRQPSLSAFIRARVLRIFPGLLVMLLLTVFVLGAALSTLPLAAYLASSQTHAYLAQCATLFMGVSYTLPGVFAANPYPLAVNGSLWTMPYEVRLYSLLAAIWLVLRILPHWRPLVFRVLMLLFTLASGVAVLQEHFQGNSDDPTTQLFFMFFCGASFYCLRQYIVLSHRQFGLCLVALCLASVNRHAFFVTYLLTLGWILCYLAYIPAGWIRRYNRIGDYSYGVYIYAFPVQQTIAAVLPGVTVGHMMWLSALLTLPLAVLSWHGVEQRCLRFKREG